VDYFECGWREKSPAAWAGLSFKSIRLELEVPFIIVLIGALTVILAFAVAEDQWPKAKRGK
jgi:hypothetical protein